jgi:probable F420-dependent oxidoreductase
MRLFRLTFMRSASDRPVRIALQIRPQDGDYAAIRQVASEAEELGVDILFNWDHFFPLGPVREGKHFECWTMLGAWAEATSRVEIGALVTCNSYRNPDLLADMARTVDHISNGRLILGIGAGFKEREYVEYGYEFGTVGTRLADLGDALTRIERRFAVLNPPPTRKIPVLIGGSGEQKTLRLVARHADIWHTFTEGEALAHKTAILEQHCAEIGRDPAGIERSTFVDGKPEGRGDALRKLGITLFVIGSGGPDYDLGELRDWIVWRDAENA